MGSLVAVLLVASADPFINTNAIILPYVDEGGCRVNNGVPYLRYASNVFLA